MHFWSTKMRKKSLPVNYLKSLPLKTNEKYSLLVNKNSKKNTSKKRFKITYDEKIMKNNHFWSTKIGKKSLQEKVYKITSGENTRKTITSGQQNRKKSLPEKLRKSLLMKKK